MTGQGIVLRPAVDADVDPIVRLLQPYAEQGLVLARTPDDIRGWLGNFIVAENGTRVVGCVALRDFSDNLHEVRSLVVHADMTGGGLGSKLVAAAVELARARGARRVFTLTVRPRIFERQGFHIVDKDLFPEKVWSDCSKCKKLECCDETALLLEMA